MTASRSEGVRRVVRRGGPPQGTTEAKQRAAAILEVLAGARTPTEAASVLGVALPRYYQLEIRALQGLVAALEPRPKVRQPSPAGRIAQLEKALLESRRETARQRALVRAAERSLGIKPSLVSEGKKHLKQQTISGLEMSLDPASFVRIHRSYVVNLERVARIEPYGKESRVAVLTSGVRLPVSKAGYARLKQLLEEKK